MKSKSMEPRQEERKLSRGEFDKVSSEIRALAGDRLKNHRDGDAERLLFSKTRRVSKPAA